ATVLGYPVACMLRNGRLLTASAMQHLLEDPALLAIQVSRRLPFKARMMAGRVLQRGGRVFPSLGALGAVMAGREAEAEAALEQAGKARGGGMSRLGAEVAVLL